MTGSEDQKQLLVAQIIELYKKNFGEITAKLYETFYSDKDIDTILASAGELLEEFLGKQKAIETLDTIKNNAGIKGAHE